MGSPERVIRFDDGSAIVFAQAKSAQLTGMEAGGEPSLEISLDGAIILAPGRLRLFRHRWARAIRAEMRRQGLWEAQGSDP